MTPKPPLFNKSFYRFTAGFLAILSVAFAVIYIVSK